MIRVLIVDDHAVVRWGSAGSSTRSRHRDRRRGAERPPGRLRGLGREAGRRVDGSGDAREERNRRHAGRASSCPRGKSARPLDAGRPSLCARRVRGGCERVRAEGGCRHRGRGGDPGGCLRGALRAPALGAKLIAAEAEERRRAAEDPLSEREREVLRLLALGHTNQEIAKAALHLRPDRGDASGPHHAEASSSRVADLVRHALSEGCSSPSSSSSIARDP